ncbi:phage minor head protein [Rodentibacter ratti]|uniref:Phage head morphogenesis domain-containing protein n=1 Tax=Rodentibacter ratti TaxID=1906745 RepID=A0A1V3L588_9PAST|nr:phage minor head protein [Rodentibacter ratti]OOF85124.1 hypothetical protein BKG88_09185 [Rodentibacter ratti]
MKQLTTIKTRRKQKIWLFPHAIEREYVKFLNGVANKISQTARQKVEEIRPRFKANLRQDGILNWLLWWLDELEGLLLNSIDEIDLQNLIHHYFTQADEFNKKQFHKVLKSAYRVNIFVSEPWLDEPLTLAELANIDLIKSIPRDLHDRLRGRFIQAVRNGERWESVKADLEKLFNLPEKRATLIARDQIGKLNGQLTRLRQENIGVKSYIWRGMLDERERERHVEREGKSFNWDEPPEDGHPGEPILCRCYAEAVLPDFDELQGVIYADKPVEVLPPVLKEIRAKNLGKRFEGKINRIYHHFTNAGIGISSHGLVRLAGRLDQSIFSIDDIIEWVKNTSPNYIDSRNGRLIRFSKEKGMAIIQSPKDGKIITFETLKEASKSWIKK